MAFPFVPLALGIGGMIEQRKAGKRASQASEQERWLAAMSLFWAPAITGPAIVTAALTGLFGGLGAVGLDVGGRALAGSEV